MSGVQLYTEPDEQGFIGLEERFSWFSGVLEVEYGEREADKEVPEPLNWLRLLPEELYWDIDEAECVLALEDKTRGYACTVWDASGEEDIPWAVFLVDDSGPRLLSEYSVLTTDASEETVEEALRRAQEELPDRLLAGEFTRAEETIPVPEWLYATSEETEEA